MHTLPCPQLRLPRGAGRNHGQGLPLPGRSQPGALLSRGASQRRSLSPARTGGSGAAAAAGKVCRCAGARGQRGPPGARCPARRAAARARRCARAGRGGKGRRHLLRIAGHWISAPGDEISGIGFRRGLGARRAPQLRRLSHEAAAGGPGEAARTKPGSRHRPPPASPPPPAPGTGRGSRAARPSRAEPSRAGLRRPEPRSPPQRPGRGASRLPPPPRGRDSPWRGGGSWQAVGISLLPERAPWRGHSCESRRLGLEFVYLRRASLPRDSFSAHITDR